MIDRKPPRSTDGERATLLGLLQYQRDSLVRKVEGVAEDDAIRELVASGTTLLWLVRHLADAETLWVVQRFAGENASVLHAHGDHDTVTSAIAAYRASWRRVDAIIADRSLDELCHGLGDDEQPASLRWVLMHLLEETARHAGHADILRELLDGSTGR
jgi:uncharacterized damage-inducible protein DinB